MFPCTMAIGCGEEHTANIKLQQKKQFLKCLCNATKRKFMLQGFDKKNIEF